MASFKEGKQTLEDLTKLRDFRNELKELKKPGKAPETSVNDAFNAYYVYFKNIAHIMGKYFKDKNMSDLLEKAGVSEQDIKTYLVYWATFDGKSWADVSSKMRWGYEPDGGPRRLADIQEIANDSSMESARLASLEGILGIKVKGNTSVKGLIAGICDEFLQATYKVCSDTEKTLTTYLKDQKAPKTNVIDYLRKDRSFE